jgi:DNA-binding SARP family transcriptional activator
VVEFRVLGPLEITICGERLRLGGSREQKILAMLVLEAGRVVPLGTR